MSRAVEIIGQIEQLGGVLTLDGETIHYKVPKGNPEAHALLQELRACREEAVRLLSERPAACGSASCAGCYSIGEIDGRERFIHPPKPGQDYLDWLARWQPPKDAKPQ